MKYTPSTLPLNIKMASTIRQRGASPVQANDKAQAMREVEEKELTEAQK